MLEFAELLTTTPSGIIQDWVDELRSVGWADADVVDIVHVTALLNYMCRLADGLGVELQPDRGWENQAPELSFQGDTAPKVFGNLTSAPTTQPSQGKPAWGRRVIQPAAFSAITIAVALVLA